MTEAASQVQQARVDSDVTDALRDSRFSHGCDVQILKHIISEVTMYCTTQIFGGSPKILLCALPPFL